MSEVTVTFGSIDEVVKVNKLLEARNKSSLRNRKKEVTRKTNRQELFIIDVSDPGDMFTRTISVDAPVVLPIDPKDKAKAKPKVLSKEDIARKKLIRRLAEEVISIESNPKSLNGQVKAIPHKHEEEEEE